MQIKMVRGVILGSIVVHAVVTACSSPSSALAETDASVAAPAAAAAEVSPEPCTKTYQGPAPPPIADAGAPTIHYAEHAYPGKSKFEIAAHVSHWVPIDDPSADLRPPDYAGGLNLQSAVYARDGFAGAGCREGTTTYFIYRP